MMQTQDVDDKLPSILDGYCRSFQEWLDSLQTTYYLMSNRNQESTQAKQIYLRDHIPKEQYQDFADYCESTVGSLDIESWSMNYVRDLVLQFQAMQKEKARVNKYEKPKSFYDYQTGNQKELQELRQKIRKEQQQTSGKSPHTNKDNEYSQKPSQQPLATKPVQKEQPSAMALLDSIFDKEKNISQYDSKKYDKSFFESCNFWEVPGESKVENQQNTSANPGNYTTNKKPLEANFEEVFTTGLNIEALKQASPEKKVPKPKPTKAMQEDVAIKKNQEGLQGSRTREWKLMEIPIEDDEGVVKPKVKTIPKVQEQFGKKSNIKLVSVKEIKNPSKKTPYKGQVLIKKPFSTKVACFKSFQRMSLSAKDLRVTITNHQIIQRRFFSSNYPMFHLKVEPTHIVCKRNFEDFQKLKSNLQSIYPGIRLPHLQKAGWLESETSSEYIAKQKKYLQYFIEDVISHHELRNSRIVQDFLTIKDHKVMKRKFEEYQKIKKVNSIEELCLIKGQVPIQITEQHRQYNQFLPELLDQVRTFWDKQQSILKEIDGLYAALADRYSRWTEAIREVRSYVQQFNQKVAFRQICSLEICLNDLHRFSSECQNFNENEGKFLAADFLPLFSFEQKNMALLSKISEVQAGLMKSYLKRRDIEESEEDIPYLSDRLKDYKQSVLDESSHFTVLKHQCGYANELVCQEAERYFCRLSKKITQVISDVCYAKLSKLTQSVNVCTELVIS